MIPLRTDRPLRSTPWVNYILIGANVAIFLLVATLPPEARNWVALHFNLWPQVVAIQDASGAVVRAEPRIWQFITSAFLHAGLWHLAGNMLFLWVFGNLLEDKFGHVGYLFFYLAAAVCSGIGHGLASDNPALGASGAIAGVTGAFLALFPQTRIRVLWFLFIITIFDIPSMWFIGFSIARDIWMQITPGNKGVAYMAHISGNFFGIFVGLGILWLRVLPREPYDLLTMITQWNRRRQFRAVTKKGYDPWRGVKPDQRNAFRRSKTKTKTKRSQPDERADRLASRSDPTNDRRDRAGDSDQSDDAPRRTRGEPDPTDPRRNRIMDLRHEVLEAITRGDMAGAMEQYRELLRMQPETVMSQSAQLDLANSLFSNGDYANAERAYRGLLEAYPNSDRRGEVNLMLGLTLMRYLDRPRDARPYLKQAAERSPQGENRELAESLLAQIEPGEENHETEDKGGGRASTPDESDESSSPKNDSPSS